MNIGAMGLPDNRIRFSGGDCLQRKVWGLSVHYERKGSLLCAIIKGGLCILVVGCGLRGRGKHPDGELSIS